ncbi:MAG: CoA-binding protein [Chloroflexi bacterium]|nr:CoA-binding protein [Chloroflexota bacterium]
MEHFRGRVYSVQIDKDEAREIEALGFHNYSSLLEIPEAVDYVVVAVPRSVTPRIIQDCIEKKVGGVALFTAGFAETGTEEGLRLQNILQCMAGEAGLNLIGPNCMGIFNPALGVRHSAEQYYGEGGDVGFIAQSGTQASLFGAMAFQHGVRVSKSVSYGNAIVLDAPDYLDYLLSDEETKAIGMYIEGTGNGRRLMESLAKTTMKKPVVIWKGGQTGAGARAIASHTASLTRSPAVWETAIKQCGALSVNSLDSLIDTIKLTLRARQPGGRRVALVAISGGQSVAMADTFAREELEVPRLTNNSYDNLATFFNITGGNYNNPVDISWTIPSIEMVVKLLTVLDQDENVDTVVMELPVFFLAGMGRRDASLAERVLGGLAAFDREARKPFVVILTAGAREKEAVDVRQQVIARGLLTFPDFERAARALRIMFEYNVKQAGVVGGH